MLVFALSVPFWLVGALAERLSIAFPFNLPVSALVFVCPLMAASILIYRKEGLAGIGRLFERAFDYRGIRHRIWYVPIIFLLPAVFSLTYWALLLMGRPLPEPRVSFLSIPILFVVFFITATGEEAGWMGYAVDPLQRRWNALGAGLFLGVVWGLFHVVPDLQAHQTWAFVAGQRLYSVALRVLIVWLYNNNGKSLLAAILFHAMDNVSVYSIFPDPGPYYDPAIAAAITAVVALIVTYLWGPGTLARFKYPARP